MRIIAGTHKNRRIEVPKGNSVRPTPAMQRERLFNMVQHLIEEADILDLYAGTAALSLEALSRGAATATAIERNKESLRYIQKNAKNLNLLNELQVIRGDVLTILPKFAEKKRQFLIIFADPPFEDKKEGAFLSQKTLEAIDTLDLLAPGGICFIEHATKLPLETAGLKNLNPKTSKTTGDSTLTRFEHSS